MYITRANRKWIAAVTTVFVVGAVTTVASGAFGGGAHSTASLRPPPATRHRGGRPLRPVYNPPSRGNSGANLAVEQAENAKIARAAARNSAAWAAIGAMTLPPAAPSAQFPAIPSANRQTPDSYATAFVTELLNIDFAKQARRSLLSWAVSETSPEVMPGTPALAAGKFLYSNLTASDSPIPAAKAWTAKAAAGVTWSASGVSTTTCPIWTQVLATGWQPSDLRMDCLDVTGNLTVTRTGQPPAVHPFSLELGVGTAEYHKGYGAMSVNNWTVG